MFKLLRFYSVVSFILIFFTAALLALFYRQVSIHWIEHMSERDNLAMARAVLNSVEPELLMHLNAGSDASGRWAARQSPSRELIEDISRMMKDTSVDRIKIYDRNGQVFFSTKADQIGSSEMNSPGFRSAINGGVFNAMTYRDKFDSIEEAYGEDNLMHTYIPIQNGSKGPILGVLEIHSNQNELVQENSKAMLLILAGAEIILAILYFILLFVVGYAKNIIEAQHKTIQERTASLENVSKQLLKNTEKEKQKIAFNLHEGIAQTLSAIKIRVEGNTSGQITADDASTQQMEAIVPVLQSAIQEVRSIATELRPSSLDSLGLLPAINGFCREFEKKHNRISIQREVSIAESAIPAAIKIDIFRIIELAFKKIARYSRTDQIRLSMRHIDNMIELVICDSPLDRSFVATIAEFDSGSYPQLNFSEIKERTLLSGGTFFSTRDNAGWDTICATWPC